LLWKQTSATTSSTPTFYGGSGRAVARVMHGTDRVATGCGRPCTSCCSRVRSRLRRSDLFRLEAVPRRWLTSPRVALFWLDGERAFEVRARLGSARCRRDTHDGLFRYGYIPRAPTRVCLPVGAAFVLTSARAVGRRPALLGRNSYAAGDLIALHRQHRDTCSLGVPGRPCGPCAYKLAAGRRSQGWVRILQACCSCSAAVVGGHLPSEGRAQRCDFYPIHRLRGVRACTGRHQGRLQRKLRCSEIPLCQLPCTRAKPGGPPVPVFVATRPLYSGA
jgi:hypothetical protein